MQKNHVKFPDDILQSARMLARFELHPEIIPPGEIEKHIEKTKDLAWRVIVEHEKKKLLR